MLNRLTTDLIDKSSNFQKQRYKYKSIKSFIWTMFALSSRVCYRFGLNKQLRSLIFNFQRLLKNKSQNIFPYNLRTCYDYDFIKNCKRLLKITSYKHWLKNRILQVSQKIRIQRLDIFKEDRAELFLIKSSRTNSQKTLILEIFNHLIYSSRKISQLLIFCWERQKHKQKLMGNQIYGSAVKNFIYAAFYIDQLIKVITQYFTQIISILSINVILIDLTNDMAWQDAEKSIAQQDLNIFRNQASLGFLLMIFNPLNQPKKLIKPACDFFYQFLISYQTFVMSWCSITQTLLWKNYLVFKAHRSKYLLIYLSPIVVLLVVAMLQAWTTANFTWQTLNPPTYELSPIPKCYGADCLTIGVVYQGKKEPYMDTVIQYLRSANGLSDKDVRQLPQTSKTIMNYIQTHPNKTQSILVFCSNSSWTIGKVQIPCFAEDYHLNFYTIIYNLSLFHSVPYMSNLKQSYPKDLVTLKLKLDVDTAIIKHYNPSARLNITFADFPSRTSRFVNGISIMSQYGSFFIMIPYLALLVMEGGRLLIQKEKRLRIGLNIIGVTHFQFYFAEILTYYLHVIIISLIFCIAGWILDFKMWSKGIIIFDLYILTTNGLILGLLALCVTAAVSERGLGMSILYGFLLFSVVVQWLFSGGLLINMLYFTNASATIKSLKYFFNCYPAFHFSKLFTDISRKADSHIDTFENRFVEGTQFKWADMFVQEMKSFQKPINQTYILPSPFESSIYLLLTSFSFLFMLWILDNLVESNRGYKQNLISFRNKKRKNSDQYQGQIESQLLVKITNLQKTYGNNIFALNGVTAQLRKGEIVALLGQNGAGKSTLINILIGALAKSRGQALIDGIDVQSDIAKIRSVIGVCPQFDILWEELTAGQHIELFHRLKKLRIQESQILSQLRNVSLDKNKDGRVNTFSGGMRRRLSLALSLTGNPKLIILDEPTTGMDAKVRLLTWKLILGLRQKLTVLITTHNMQQAECVSDRIMIMSKGRIIAQGTTLQLKKQYGQGYIIRGVDPSKNNQQIQIRCKEEELQKVLGQLQQGKIQNWSLHQTTLEEVFLNVSNRY